MARRILVILCFLAALLGAPAAGAAGAEKKVQVITILSPNAYQHAKALSTAMRLAISSEGWTLAKGDYSLEVMVAALGCPETPNDKCLRKIARRIKSDRFIWGTLDEIDGQVVAHVRLFEGKKNRSEARVTYSSKLDDPANPALVNIATNIFAELQGEKLGEVAISVGSLEGSVFLDDAEVDKLDGGKASIKVRPGRQVTLKIVPADGSAPISREVELEPGERKALKIDATKKTLPKTDPEKAKPVVADPGGGPSMRTVLAWTAIGAGGVAALVGGGFALGSLSQTQSDEWKAHLEQTPSDRDPCTFNAPSNIQDLCSANDTAFTMSAVLLPVGAVLATVGIVMLVTDPGDKGPEQKAARRGPSWEPHFGIGPTGGAFDVTVKF